MLCCVCVYVSSFGVQVDFEVEDALDKLLKADVLRLHTTATSSSPHRRCRHDGRLPQRYFVAKPPAEAIPILQRELLRSAAFYFA